VPLRLTVDVPPVEELLEKVMLPIAEPATVGEKLTCKVATCPGLRVRGNVAPDILKPAPVIVAELTVTAAVPEEVSVSVLVEVDFRFTLPKAIVPALKAS